MKNKRRWQSGAASVFGVSLVALALHTPLAAQGLQKEQGEVTGLVGGLFAEGSSLAYGGGGYGAISDRFAVGGEVTYAPGAGFDSGGSSVDTSAVDVHGGVQYLLMAGEKSQPYLAGGLGVMRASAEASTTINGQQFGDSASGTAFLVHVGGGLRYWVGDRWGVKPELKVFFGDTTAVRASVGLFYQFGE